VIHGPVASDTTRTGQTKVDSIAKSQLAADPHSTGPVGQPRRQQHPDTETAELDELFASGVSDEKLKRGRSGLALAADRDLSWRA
jgi:hypothetical protein